MRTVIVTAALIMDLERILIAQRKGKGPRGFLWEFPGGKVREEEEPREALRRELKEELDIVAKVGTIFEAVYHVYPEYPVLLLAYLCHIERGRPRPLDCQDLRWVRVQELAEFSMPQADAPIREKLCSLAVSAEAS